MGWQQRERLLTLPTLDKGSFSYDKFARLLSDFFCPRWSISIAEVSSEMEGSVMSVSLFKKPLVDLSPATFHSFSP